MPRKRGSAGQNNIKEGGEVEKGCADSISEGHVAWGHGKRRSLGGAA